MSNPNLPTVHKPDSHEPDRRRRTADGQALTNKILPIEELLHELRVHQIELKMQNEELRHAQLQLEASRDRYVDLYEFAPIGYLTLSSHGLITEINLAGSQLLAAERKKLLKSRFSSFIAEPDLVRWYDFFSIVISDTAKDRYIFTLQLQRSDKSIIHAQLDCLRVADGDALPTLRMALTDISARKLDEMRLKQSEDKYRTLFESLDQGYCVIEMRIEPNEPLDYCFIEVNQAFEAQSTLRAAKGRWMREMVPMAEEFWFERYRDVALTGVPASFEAQLKALEERWFSVYAFRIGRPELKHVAVLFSNISARKNAQAISALEQGQLEDMVRERTRQLLRNNKELALAKHNAEVASQAKSDILSNTSHELRTPLNSLLMLAGLLAENPDKNLSLKEVKYASTILDAGNDLLMLVNDLLDLAQIESGNPLAISLSPVDFNYIQENLTSAFAELARRKQLHFGIHLAEDLPAVFCTDEKRLLQILKNLLANAFKFTSSGEVLLTIATIDSGWPAPHATLDAAGMVIQFAISDTGIGIAPNKLRRVFEAFHQADTGTARQFGGSGLGLTISRQLAALLGGALGVTSELGKGSTFKLYLPA